MPGVAAGPDPARLQGVPAVAPESWPPDREHDRLGVDDPATELVGVRLPLLHIPVSARRRFAARLDRGLQRPPPLPATSEEDTQ